MEVNVLCLPLLSFLVLYPFEASLMFEDVSRFFSLLLLLTGEVFFWYDQCLQFSFLEKVLPEFRICWKASLLFSLQWSTSSYRRTSSVSSVPRTRKHYFCIMCVFFPRTFISLLLYMSRCQIFSFNKCKPVRRTGEDRISSWDDSKFAAQTPNSQGHQD